MNKDGAEKPAAAATPAKPAGDKINTNKEDPAPNKAATPPVAGAKISAAPTTGPGGGKPVSTNGTGEVEKKPIGAAAGEPSKPEQMGKPGPEAGKGNAVAPAIKVASEATTAGNGETKSEAPTAESKEGAKANAGKPKPEKINWTEQPKWRDGTPATLQGANSTYYLARKIVSTHARTAIVQIEGPAGFRMWINGELAQTSLPPPPAEPSKGASGKATNAANAPDAKTDEKADDGKNEPIVPELNDSDFDAEIGRGRHGPEKKFRIGLRQGDNEIVLKAVFGAGVNPNGRRAPSAAGPMGGGDTGGGSFTFDITPEGDDVLTHEVATDLRLEALNTLNQAHPCVRHRKPVSTP